MSNALPHPAGGERRFHKLRHCEKRDRADRNAEQSKAVIGGQNEAAAN